MVFLTFTTYAQSPTCAGATPLCANGADFGNSTNVPSLGSMNCLGTTPNPVWYYSLAQTTGSITMSIEQVDINGTGRDVDFAIWGPYSSLSDVTNIACPDIMDGSPPTPLDCSYSATAYETATFNVVAGMYYVILMTNYSNQVGQISIRQTGGSGLLDCSPLCPSRSLDIYTSTSGGSAYLDMVEGCLDGQIDFWIDIPFTTNENIPYTVSGTATSGVDFVPLSGSVNMSAGVNHGVINITPIADGVVEGTETITLTFYSPCSMDSIIGTVTMNILDGYSYSVSADTTVCPNATIQLTAVAAPGSTYSWLPTGALSNPTIPNPIAVVDTTTTFYVNITQPSCPIIVTDSVVITVDSLPLQITGVLDYCEGANTVLTASGGATYVWNNNSTSSSLTVTEGTYTVTATSAIGCTAVDSVVVVETPIPVIQFLQTPNPLCFGQGPTVISAGSQPGVNYVWSTGGVSDTIVSLTSGTVSVTAEQNGCSATGSYTINAAQAPTLSLGTPKNTCCQNVVLNANPDPSLSYIWSTGSTEGSITITNDSTIENEIYTVTVTNAGGCSVVLSDTVSIRCIRAQLSTNPDTILIGITPNNEAFLDVYTAYNGNFSYIWQPDSSLGTTGSQSTIATPSSTTVYRVIVEDLNYGCVDSVTLRLVVIEPGEVAMPTAFTPNGDGNNDVYFPVYFSTQTVLHEFRVYNRWGELLHNNPLIGWDGKYKGEDQSAQEVYTYYVHIQTPDRDNPGTLKTIKKKGSFTLFR